MPPFPTVDEIDAVLLDAGETLIFMQPSFVGAFVKVAKSLGHDLAEEDLAPGLEEVNRRLQERARSRPDLRVAQDAENEMWREFNRVIFSTAGLASNDVETVAEAMQTNFNQGKLNRAADDTHATLQRLRVEGLRLAVVSNAVCEMADVLDACGITPLVDHVTVSCAMGWEKPAPEIFQHALEALDVEPSRAIHVGDSLGADIHGAERAGLAGSVLFLNGAPPPAEHTGPMIHRLSELLPLMGIK